MSTIYGVHQIIETLEFIVFRCKTEVWSSRVSVEKFAKSILLGEIYALSKFAF